MAVNLLATSPSTTTLSPSPCVEDPGFPLSSLDSEDYVFVEARHPNKVLEGLNSLRLNNAFCDVTLCCGGQEFPCHRIVLASFSSYFQAMFSTDLMESRQERVAINGVEPQMIGMLVSYAYTAEVVISKANVQALLAAANLLDVMAVREACCRFMERQMDEMNCVGIHCFAEAHSCRELEQRSMEYIQQHFSTVCQQEEFLSLCADKLTEIISSDHLNVPKEETVFEAAVVILCLPKLHLLLNFQHHYSSLQCCMLYLAGGEFPDGSASREMWRYDPCFDSWSEMAPMNVARSELGLVMLDGYVFAVGGWEGRSRLDSVECYNPQTNTWQFMESVKMAVTSPAVVALDGLLYVTGGAVLEDGDGTNLAQAYNPKTCVWTEVAPMQIARSGSAACILKGKIYVIGGWHASTENTDKVESYDPKTNKWTMCAPMKERRYRPGVAVVDGKIYVLGGEEGWDRYHDTIERYCEESDSWEIVGEMPTSRSWLSCVSLQLRKDSHVGSRPGTALETEFPVD
uniref:Kelch-like protein 17 n=1 Tax=Sinocyclocheilus grahami TaxID=75366 RepID=A0A672P0Y3_SINGR